LPCGGEHGDALVRRKKGGHPAPTKEGTKKSRTEGEKSKEL